MLQEKKTENRKTPPISKKALLAAAVFFFNPNLNLIDILPDCIGCFFLIYALRGLSDAIPHFPELKEKMQKLLVVTLVKLPATLIMFSLGASDRVSITLFSFSFAILEAIFLFPALASLFEGISYLNERFDVNALVPQEKNWGPSFYQSLSYVFFTSKFISSALPELSFLFTFDFLTGEGNTVSSRQYLILAGILFLVVFVIGLLWLLSTLPVFSALAEGANASEELRDQIEKERALYPEKANRPFPALPYLLLGCGVLLNIDLQLDSALFPPDYLSAAALLLLTVIWYRERRTGYHSLSLSALYFASSVLFAIFRSRYLSSFEYGDMQLGEAFPTVPNETLMHEARLAYLPVLILGAISAFAFAALLFDLLRRLKAELIPASTTLPESDFDRRLRKEETGRIRRLTIASLVFSTLSSLASILWLFLVRYTTSVDTQPGYGGGKEYIPTFAAFRYLLLLLEVITAILVIRLLSKRKTEDPDLD